MTCFQNTRTTYRHDGRASEPRHLQLWPSLVLRRVGWPALHAVTNPTQTDEQRYIAPPRTIIIVVEPVWSPGISNSDPL